MHLSNKFVTALVLTFGAGCSDVNKESMPATYIANFHFRDVDSANIIGYEKIKKLGAEYQFQVKAGPIPDGLQFQMVLTCSKNMGAYLRTSSGGKDLDILVFEYAFSDSNSYESFKQDLKLALESTAILSAERFSPVLDEKELRERAVAGNFEITPRCGKKQRSS